MEVDMVFHTGDAGVGSRQPTRHDVGNRLPLTPNVPLSCADMRHTVVNLCLSRIPYFQARLLRSTLPNGSTKSNRSHGGPADGRTTPAPSVLVREAGARANFCHAGTIGSSHSNRSWGHRGSQGACGSSRTVGEASCFRTEEAEATENAHTTNLIALSFLTVAVGYAWAAAAWWLL